jgi:hypothetical protein
MENSDPLVVFGIALICVMGALVLVPYMRRKSDLLTAWNVLLIGIAMFAGFGGLEVKYGEFTWPKLQWFQPSRHEVQYYIFATTAFVAALVLCHYYDPIGKALTRRALQKWPPLSTALCMAVLLFCGVCVGGSFAATHFAAFGQYFANIGQKAAIMAVVFSFMMWYQRPTNVILLGLFLGVFAIASVYSMLVFVGRRLLLSVFLGPVLYVYWNRVRQWKPWQGLLAVVVAGLLVTVVGIAYSSFRFYSRGHFVEERTAKTVLDQVKKLRGEGISQLFLSNKLHYISQWSAHYALLLTHLVDDGAIEPRPLNTLRFLVALPIPRKLWEDKPEVIGLTLVRDWMQDQSTNWGVGIAGHGAYEGGIPALALYAFLLSILMNYIDAPMRAQPTNPFLISTLASAVPHVMGIPRGDFGIMTANVIECILFTILVGFVARFLFGTDRSSQNNSAYLSHPGLTYGGAGRPALSGKWIR